MPEPVSPLPVTAGDIVDTLREPLLVLDAGLRVRRANRAFYRAFKVTPEETEGRLVYELGNHQWDIPQLRRLLEDVLPRDSFFDDFEVVHDFESIGRKVMLLNARRVFRESNHTESILLAIEDITDRRRLENERAELETRFTSLVKNIRDHSIFTLDPLGHITSWNREAEKILGFTEAEVLGKPFSIIFSEEDLVAGIPDLELTTALRDGRAEDERWHIRKNGERFWALGIVTPTQDASGKHTGYSKILRDMTDRKQAEDGLRQADRRKDEFLATLAHELRNPLAPIRNGLELLKLTADPATWEQAREMMERQLMQMVRLVDDLLDISRITRNKLELRKAPVELWAVVQNAVETARPQIEESGHTLTVTLPPLPISLDADLTRLAQVFWNLLNNSAKYTQPGGRISLTAELDGGEAVVTVQDNGIGIPVEAQPTLFEMFSQVDRSLERAQGGLGIGLALVKGLTEAHGGRVEVHSQGVGRGCTFTVRLPVTDRQPGAPQPAADAAPPAAKCRILVVDDNRDGAASMAMLLKVMGNDTCTAHDGLSAIETAEAFRPDLIVLDIGLPRLNGFEVCRRIREREWAKEILIVAATGWGQDEDRRRSQAAGFDRHFVKPVDAAELHRLLLQRLL
jgi:two-component system, chemotaxis family, CheB/CheR fusion protein